jgi:hypothetical protein
MLAMQVYVNGHECDIPAGVASFGDLVFFVEQQRLPHGEVLTQISLDGKELDEQEESAAAARPCSSIERAEFFSARPLELARDGLSDAGELLPSLAEDLPRAAAAMRSGKLSEGLEMFAPCLEVVSWYVSLLNALDVLLSRDGVSFSLHPGSAGDVDSMGEELDGASDAPGDIAGGSELRSFASIENLRQKLVDIERAQQQSDHLLLADLIEYELLPIVQIWADESPRILHTVSTQDAVA